MANPSQDVILLPTTTATSSGNGSALNIPEGFAGAIICVQVTAASGTSPTLNVFLQDQIIYQIHFLDGDIMVGCRAQELIPAGQPWDAGMLQFGDPVTALQPLSINGAVVVSAGATGQIEATDQGHDGNSYTVTFSGRWFQVPASALRLAEEIA